MPGQMTFQEEDGYIVCYIDGKEVSRSKMVQSGGGTSPDDVIDIINEQIKANPVLTGSEPSLKGIEIDGNVFNTKIYYHYITITVPGALEIFTIIPSRTKSTACISALEVRELLYQHGRNYNISATGYWIVEYPEIPRTDFYTITSITWSAGNGANMTCSAICIRNNAESIFYSTMSKNFTGSIIVDVVY